LVAVIPSAITSDPQKIRLSAALPFFIVTMVYGITTGWSLLQRQLDNWKLIWKYLPRLAGWSVAFALTGWFALHTTQYFLDFYFVHTQKNDKLYTAYVRELMPYVGQFAKTHTVVMTPMMSDPVMFYAFYNQVDPQYYQENVVLGPLEDDGWQHATALGNFRVANTQLPEVACEALLNNQPTLFVTDQPYDPRLIPLKKVTSMNGVHAYAYVYDALEFAQTQQLECKPEMATN